MDIAGKVFVVTGGGNGIARELVLQLLAKGATVAAVDLNAEGLKETKKLAGTGAKLSTHTLNITDRAKVMALPKTVISKHGQVDALVNVAGIIQPFVKVNDLDFDAIERVMNVNLYGTINTVKAFLPELLNRLEGYIANVSSMGGYAPVPGQTIYGATKAAVKLLTEGLHSELMDTKVHVTAIYPGAIATNIAQNSGMAMPANMDPHEANKFKTTSVEVAAHTIIGAIEKNAYKVFIGSDAKTMDKLTRLMPEKAAAMIYKQMKSLLG
ncbi:SDR family NAD(P)-dependent oxidoreductase [Aurantimicrobium minutum]|uniref:SDR family NAD(P)-dependent oxidoreductase n=1 Tax=Aurantimicrobium minutum TaxID=708131 RepID=UPI00248E9617|nr:SDR family oxidoreductase [Aurantimicrobium minutum]